MGNIRYVITHINKDGQRTLAEAMQGRNTHETEKEAQEHLDLFREGFETKLGFTGLEVRPVECFPGHNDPKTCWFD